MTLGHPKGLGNGRHRAVGAESNQDPV
jgi:hypothetical protein